MAKYSEYKDSGIPWIGLIPNHWEVKPIRSFLSQSKELNSDENAILLTLSQYKGVNIRNGNEDSAISAAESLVGYNVVHKGQFVMNIMLAWNGSYGVSEFDGVISPAYAVFNFKDNVCKAYYHYLWRTKAYQDAFKTRSKGIVDSRLRLYPQYFLPFYTSIPPKEEQEAIVAYLDRVTADIDKAITAKERIISSLEERRKIIITHAVTRGINPDAPMKDSGIDWLGEIPAHWEIRKLKSLADVKGRIGFRGYTNEDMVLEGEGAITLSPSNVNNGKVEFEKCSYLSWSKYYESPEIMVEKGHLLFVKTGSSYGKTGIVNSLPEKSTINPQFSLIKPKNILSKFLNFTFATPYLKSQVEGGVIGSTIPTISQAKIKNFIILTPPYKEQEIILDYLERELSPLDLSIAQQKKLIDLLRERKNIIINETVTGKVKVI